MDEQSLDAVQLAEWYRRLGFERVADRTDDDEPRFFRPARPSYVPSTPTL